MPSHSMPKYILLLILSSALCLPAMAVDYEYGRNQNDTIHDHISQDLIPRKVLFGNPDRTTVRMSPDGKYIAYLAPVNEVLNVWVAPADNLSQVRVVTNDTYRGIRSYGWMVDTRFMFYLQDVNGDENWRIYGINLESDDIFDLTPIKDVQAQVIRGSLDHPTKLLVGLNDKDPRYHRVYLLDVENRTRTLVMDNDQFASFVADEDLKVRLAMKMTPDGGAEYFSLADDGTWKQFLTVGLEDSLTTYPIFFRRDGQVLYMADSQDWDTSALISMDMNTSEIAVLAQDPRVDLSTVVLHPQDRTPQWVAFEYQRQEFQVLDKSIDKDLKFLKNVSDGDMEVISRTLADDRWIVAYEVDDGPVKYYLYDRRSGNVTFLFTNRQDLEGLPLSSMIPVTIKARDELDLVGYYTLPHDSGNGTIPEKPLPMVLVVHGGPWSRDVWGFNSLHQWLANRGYAVMSVNFRGSTGFGKNFLNAGNKEWGAKMHDDLIDAANWAVDQRIADPQKVAIMGGSYGGYSVLVGLTMTPDVFVCGVDLVGPSNLVTLMETIPPYWFPEFSTFVNRVGDNSTEEGRAFLMERSPISHVENITRPLLIAQGANDPRVKRSESDQIVQSMEDKGIPVTYLIYSDEGHGFARPENRLSFYAVAEVFLSRCLGGSYQPVEDDFNGSTISIATGADQVPWLPEAVKTKDEGTRP